MKRYYCDSCGKEIGIRMGEMLTITKEGNQEWNFCNADCLEEYLKKTKSKGLPKHPNKKVKP